MIQQSMNEMEQWKWALLMSLQEPERQTIERLWERVETMCSKSKTLEIMQYFIDHPQIAYIMSSMSDQQLLANISSMIPQQIEQNQHFHQEIQMRPYQNKSSQPDMFMYQEDSSIISQQTLNQPQVDENVDFSRYFKYLVENNLQKNQEFNRVFKESDFDEFFYFFLSYQEQKLLEKEEILDCSQYEMVSKDETLDGLKRQILITDSALYFTSPKYRLRLTQILAIYCFLAKSETTKILLQILTGEGKSTTIACLSAILVMRGYPTDIITTSPILVKRDVEQKKPFFDLLGMKFDHNLNEKPSASLQPKKCYAGLNIVIGTPFSFQVDMLYDEYQQRETRNKRPYKVVIIDEVDSMLIDEKSNQTLLASQFAGFSELITSMRIIWQTIVTKDIIKEGDKIFLYQKGQKIGEIIKGEANQVMRVIIDDLRKKFNNQFVPKWRLQFIECSLENWIDSAIIAAHIYKQDHHYIVEKGKIVPVNYRSNGCLQRNVHWQNGLHQFLQMKHGLHVKSQTMTSNFMSNIGHFLRYKTLYGLSGTLGSPESKRFLQFTYDVEMLDIPPNIERKLQIQPGFLMFSEFQWLNKIVEQTKSVISKKRAVLIICETIQDTDVISYALKEKRVGYTTLRVFQTGQQNHQDIINCKQIIIATNVAGRGTDLKAKKKLISKGGLHVIISFMPENYRVEMQARGRAGRNGAPGTSELIVNYQKYCEQIGLQTYSQSFFGELRMDNKIKTFCQDYRDVIEAESMKKDKQTVTKLKTKDKMFQFFCQAVKKIPDYTTNNAKKQAIEEQWAMFLKKVQKFDCSNEQMQQQAKQLANQFTKNSEGFYNPSHGVWRGINSYSKNNFKEAKEHFQKLQNPQLPKINNIAGCVLQAAVRINQDDKKAKSDYQNAINLLQKGLGNIAEKKEIQKSKHALNMTVDNQNSLRLLENEAQQSLQQRSINVFTRNNLQAMELNENSVPNERINQLQRRQVNRLMQPPSFKVLNQIEKHIHKQIEKIASVKQDEYVEMDYISLKNAINLKQTDEENQDMKDAYQNLVPDLPYLPQAKIKQIPKKKTSFWKRLLVFCVGVFQVVVGSLITAASCGAAASFGSTMIFQGINDCMNALFKPQVCNDLKGYFTEKALKYTLSLATIGLSGIQQLARISSRGFSIIQNSSIQNIFKKTVQNIGIGFAKGIVNYEGVIKQRLFQGISSKLLSQKEKQKQIQAEDIFKVVKQPQFRKKVEKAGKQEEKLEFDGKRIKQEFEKKFESLIKNVIEQNISRFIEQIKNLNLNPDYVSALITISYKETFESHFHKSETQQNKIMQKKIFHFVSKYLNDPKLAEKIILQFGIDKLIIDSMRNVGKNKEYYTKVVLQSKLEIFNKIVTLCHEIIDREKPKLENQVQSLKNQLRSLESSALTPLQYNARINQYNTRVQNYKNNQKILNQFIQQFKNLPEKDKIIDYFMDKGIIVNGKINKTAINSNTEFHQYLKEVLLKLQDFQPSEKNFKEELMTKAYNTFSGMVVNAVNQVIDNSSNSVSRLKEIQNKLFKDLYQTP